MKKRKSIITGISLLLASSVLIGCSNNNPPEAPLVFEKLDIQKDKVTLTTGDEQDLSLIVKANKEEYEEKVVWTSSDPSVATVDENGKVKAIKVGTAVITAKIGELTDICNVTVTDDEHTYIFVGLSK